jgi:hypothetical protein
MFGAETHGFSTKIILKRIEHQAKRQRPYYFSPLGGGPASSFEAYPSGQPAIESMPSREISNSLARSRKASSSAP